MNNKYAFRRAVWPSSSRAFTLIEIMIVVVIIAALAAMVVPRLSGRSEQAKRAIAESDIRASISTALRLYELENGHYPTTAQGLQALLVRPTTEPIPYNWNGPYLESEPIDPWNRPYQYRRPGTHNPAGYDLFSLGQDGIEGTDDDVTNWR